MENNDLSEQKMRYHIVPIYDNETIITRFKTILKKIIDDNRDKYYKQDNRSERYLQVTLDNSDNKNKGLISENLSSSAPIELYLEPRNISGLDQEGIKKAEKEVLLLLYIIIPNIINTFILELTHIENIAQDNQFVRIHFAYNTQNIYITINRFLEQNGVQKSNNQIEFNKNNLIFKRCMGSLIDFYNDDNNFEGEDNFTLKHKNILKDLLTYFNICKTCNKALNTDGDCININCDNYILSMGGARLKFKRNKSRNKSKRKSRKKRKSRTKSRKKRKSRTKSRRKKSRTKSRRKKSRTKSRKKK